MVCLRQYKGLNHREAGRLRVVRTPTFCERECEGAVNVCMCGNCAEVNISSVGWCVLASGSIGCGGGDAHCVGVLATPVAAAVDICLEEHRPSMEFIYRGTSLMRNSNPLGPYSRTLPGALRWS